ncbi:MAG: hypothetical protein HQL46_14020 [Gammaproteobacteria bacterium]|nr:hypothetical protein [Gammaproteobacteria bacterium]
MEWKSVFNTINKIGSSLFVLVFILMIIGIFSSIYFSSSSQDKRTIQITESDEKIELVLSNIQSIPGEDIQFIKLNAKTSGYSSYYNQGKLRNVLFFEGGELQTHWLYNTNNNFIHKFSVLRDVDNKKSYALYLEAIREDSNQNNKLDKNDLIEVSLANLNGKNIKIIEKNISSVIDYRLVNNNSEFMLLFQKNKQVIVKKFSPANYELLSEKILTEISTTHE